MTESGIIMTSESVRAILAGTKRQTRRTVKQGADSIEPHKDYPREWVLWIDGERHASIECPYGVPGDRLWVREALYLHDDGSWYYVADDVPVALSADDERVPIMVAWAHHMDRARTSPMMMPRFARRITLEVTEVRVELLHAISAKDVIAEGAVLRAHDDKFGHNPVSAYDGKVYLDLKSLYAAGWDQINAKRAPWASNPWVWVIEFRLQQGVQDREQQQQPADSNQNGKAVRDPNDRTE